MPRLHDTVGGSTVICNVPGGVDGGSTVVGSAIDALLQPSPSRPQLSNGSYFDVEQALRKSLCFVGGVNTQPVGCSPGSTHTPCSHSGRPVVSSLQAES